MSSRSKPVPLVLLCAATIFAAGCAGNDKSGDKRWLAKGWLTPTPQGEPEIIGEFDDQADCEAAVDAWMQSQVVGNPIHAECLVVVR